MKGETGMKLEVICSVAVLALCLSYIFSFVAYTVTRTKNRKVRKIKGREKGGKPDSGNIIISLANAIEPLVSNFYNKDNIRYKLIRSGGTFSHFGINESNFVSFEVLFAAVIATIMILTESSILEVVAYPAGAIIFLEWIVKMNTKSRHEKIKKELIPLIANTKEYIEQGMDVKDIFVLLPNKVKEGPLRDELVALRTRIGLMKLDHSMEHEILEMAKRIGLEEIDNYVLALTQNEITGRVTRMLQKQLDLLNTYKNQKVNRETQNRAKVSSVASICIVIMTLTVIIVPMVIYIMQNKLFAG